ncbi:hypothetical protein DdX_16673 [Ditylenchus destructor]|uniref:Uncharacterized protein n=1 Tax=Ditylenchus destructor TaxID=166010 RepID=A0AAD4QTW5_9BILA|nr:hypothetical protein DdX_16673 [Ditylenchus destructor]
MSARLFPTASLHLFLSLAALQLMIESARIEVNDVTAAENDTTGDLITAATNPPETTSGTITTTDDPCSMLSSTADFSTILVLVMAIAAALLSNRNSA